MKITKVFPNSLGIQIGIKPGDTLLRINGKRVKDEIDYRYKITDELVELEFQIDGIRKKYEIL